MLHWHKIVVLKARSDEGLVAALIRSLPSFGVHLTRYYNGDGHPYYILSGRKLKGSELRRLIEQHKRKKTSHMQGHERLRGAEADT